MAYAAAAALLLLGCAGKPAPAPEGARPRVMLMTGLPLAAGLLGPLLRHWRWPWRRPQRPAR